MKHLIYSAIAGVALYMTLFGGSGAAWLNELVVGPQGQRTVWAERNEAPEGTPDNYLVVHSGIEEAQGPIADTAEGPVFTVDVLDMPRRESSGMPRLGKALPAVGDCRPNVAAEARVYHIFADESDAKVPFSMVPGYTVQHSLEHFISVWTQKGEESFRHPYWSDAHPPVAHVVVTDRQAPVHLVLHNDGYGLLWSLQTADDVRISGITIVGGSMNALIHVGDDIPVEVMNSTSLFHCNMIAHAGHVKTLSTTQRLQIADLEVQAERFNDRWHIDEQGEYVYERTVPDWLKNMHRKARFETWFEMQFGQSFTANVIGFSKAPDLVALAGPMPEVPLSYRGIEGVALRPGPGTVVLGLSAPDVEEQYNALIVDRAREVAGGDLEAIRAAKADF